MSLFDTSLTASVIILAVFRILYFIIRSTLRVFRGSILQVLPVLAVISEDTASVGNILGYVLQIYNCQYVQFFSFGR